MADRNEIIIFTDEYLNSKAIQDISRNGLQIEGKTEIRRIAFGVSASLECMKKAESDKHCRTSRRDRAASVRNQGRAVHNLFTTGTD